MIHLDQTRLDAILDGSLAPDHARHLRRHLQAPCATCDAFLEQSTLDITTLARLLAAQEALSAPSEQGLSQAEKQADWESIRVALPDAGISPTRKKGVVLLGTFVAMAAALLIFLLPGGPYSGIKGDASAPPEIQVKILAGREEGGQVRHLQRLQDGATVPANQTLLFEIETDRTTARYLFVVEGDGQLTRLYPPEDTAARLDPPGSRPVSQADAWVVLDVADMSGPLTLVGAASMQPLDMQRGIIQPWRRHQQGDGVAYDTLTLELTP